MSDVSARPVGFTGFVLRERYRRMDLDQPGYEGLWCEIRTNLSHAEREGFLIDRDRIDQAWRDDFRAKTDAARKLDETVSNARTDKERALAIKKREAFLAEQVRSVRAIGRERFALVAPYVRAWNVCSDDYQEVPAPAVDATAAYEWIDDVIAAWLIRAVEEGYKGGPKESSSSIKSGDAPGPTSAPQSETEKAA